MPSTITEAASATHPPISTFNLLDEAWIPSQLHDGSIIQMSLRTVFEQSTEINRVMGETPLQTVSIYRLLLAIFWRAHVDHGELLDSSPTQWWAKMFAAASSESTSSSCVQPVQAYCDTVAARFDLLDPVRPFMQVADLQKPDKSYSGIDRLVVDAESSYFSTRAGTGLDSLSFAEAARWLLVINAYDYAGIKPGVIDDERVKGGKSYPIGPGWAGQTGQIVIHGQNLAQTLLLNTPASLISSAVENTEDLAFWEQDEILPIPKSVDEQFPTGPCNVLTWPSRRVRLHTDGQQVVGVLVTNGYKIVNKNQHADPLTGYRYSKNQSSKAMDVFMPMEHDSDLTLWRGVQALLSRQGVGPELAKGLQPNKPAANVSWLQQLHNNELVDSQTVNIELVGVSYGPQQSSIVDVFSSTIPMNLKVLMEQDTAWANHIVHTTLGTMDAATELGRFAGNLLAAGGGSYEFNADIKRKMLHALEAHFTQWLQEITPETARSSHRLSWEQQVHDVAIAFAWQLINSSSPRALRGKLDDDGHFTSAATALTRLRTRLDVHLPQAGAARKESMNQRSRQSASAATNESGESPA